MRPYLAIIWDSFVEAAQSRVLWVLLIAWTIILAAVAPFGLKEGTTLEIQSDQILDRTKLVEIITQTAEDKGTPAQQAIWKAMKPSFQQNIIERQKNKQRRQMPMGELIDGINSVLDTPKLYSETAWPTAAKRNSLKELLAKSETELSTTDLQRRNRELVQLAYPGLIRPGESDAMWISYAGLKVSDPLPVSRKLIRPFFEGFVLMAIFKFGVGMLGIFIGIIVTSSMVPEMFQVGSLHLLLSKPISRSRLLIAKFIGGSSFVFLNVAYLLIGFYFLVGIRLGFWNTGILACIPLIVFVFMIFYSVSMLTGLIWRNSIISIVMTALFWGLCTVLGITHGVMEVLVTHVPKVIQVTPAADTVFTVSNGGQMRMWDRTSKQWKNAFGEVFGGESIIGPFWIPEQKGLFFGQPRRLQFGMGLQSEDVKLKIAALPELAGGEDKPAVAPEAKDEKTELWSDKRIDVGPAFPPRTRRVLKWNDSLVALTERGLNYLDLEAVKAEEADQENGVPNLFERFFRGKVNSPYPSMTPDDWMPEMPLDFAYSNARHEFLVYSRGKLIVLKSEGDRKFIPEPSVDLDLPLGSLALVACNAEIGLIATNQSGVIRVELDNPAKRTIIEGTASLIPRSLESSSVDGSFGLLDRDGVFWRIDQNGTSLERPAIRFQGSISACTVDETNHWWLAHDVDAVARWNPKDNKIVEEFSADYGIFDRIYYGVVRPLYKINPKPAAVDATMQKLLTSGKPISLGRETTELEIDQGPEEDPWFAIWSNAAFIAVMLLAGCWYLHRQDL